MLSLELGQGEATVNEGSRQGRLPPARLQKQMCGREPAAARGCDGAGVGARNGGKVQRDGLFRQRTAARIHWI